MEDKQLAVDALRSDVEDKTLLLNIEYKIEKTVYATLADATTKEDIGKGLVTDALLMVDVRREKRLQKVVGFFYYGLLLDLIFSIRCLSTRLRKTKPERLIKAFGSMETSLKTMQKSLGVRRFL